MDAMSRTFSMPDTVLGECLRFGETFSATRRQKVVFAPASLGFLDGKPRLAQKSPATGRLRVFRDVRRERHRASGRFAYERRLSRLIAASYTGGQSDEAYSYDANGNRETANGSTYVTGADNRLISDGTYTYSYDAEGNRVARWVDANADGVLDTGDTDITQYAWDNRNRLVEVTNRAVFGGDPTQVVDYLYDVENRWVGEDIRANGTEHQIRFAYDGNQIVLEFEKDGSGAVTGADLSHRYLWQPNAVDQLMADERTHLDSGSIVTDELLWALTDRQGSVSDLAKRDATTGVTSVVDHIVRNSFGKVISESDPSQGSLIGWTGQPVDKATGQQNNLNRWYDPIVAGWMTQDPKGFAAGQTNLYVYCGNSPTNATDPTGLLTFGQVRPLIKHCNGNAEALAELETLAIAHYNTPSWHYSLTGGFCGAWVNAYLSNLPYMYQAGKGVIKVTPVWFQQSAPGLFARAGGAVLGADPGHYAVRIEFPDGFMVYFDNGWAGTGGIFTFQPGHGVPTPTRPLHLESPLMRGDGIGWPGW
jgi:RHS repeat-associated protein